MKRAIAAVVLTVAALSVAVLAHPMTYKGTVVSVAKASVQVKAVDDMTKKESTTTFKITAKTKIFRGDKQMTFAEAKVQKDERIAVTTNMDKAKDDAEVIRLAATK